MKSFFSKLLPPLRTDAPRKRKTLGQSLIEFAIALPVLVLILTAMMEFGFILNFYLSLLDATRGAARWASLANPLNADGTDDMDYYITTAELVRTELAPPTDGRKLILDPATDGVIVTVYCVVGGTTATRYPDTGPYNTNPSMITSAFTTADIENTYADTAPDAGLVLVEVYYGYRPVIGLFYTGKVMLRAHSIMPANAADPIPGTGCQ
ncbi:MAG TPA: TadE/TadG family type IV pilus assembly protein [Anaerolineales bacterium]|nr:TadE/TadG family type IV pilus assembly protein [Anaerolineales bacterium]